MAGPEGGRRAEGPLLPQGPQRVVSAAAWRVCLWCDSSQESPGKIGHQQVGPAPPPPPGAQPEPRVAGSLRAVGAPRPGGEGSCRGKQGLEFQSPSPAGRLPRRNYFGLSSRVQPPKGEAAAWKRDPLPGLWVESPGRKRPASLGSSPSTRQLSSEAAPTGHGGAGWEGMRHPRVGENAQGWPQQLAEPARLGEAMGQEERRAPCKGPSPRTLRPQRPWDHARPALSWAQSHALGGLLAHTLCLPEMPGRRCGCD